MEVNVSNDYKVVYSDPTIYYLGQKQPSGFEISLSIWAQKAVHNVH